MFSRDSLPVRTITWQNRSSCRFCWPVFRGYCAVATGCASRRHNRKLLPQSKQRPANMTRSPLMAARLTSENSSCESTATRYVSRSWRPTSFAIWSATRSALCHANRSSNRFGGCTKTPTLGRSTILLSVCAGISRRIRLVRSTYLLSEESDIGLCRNLRIESTAGELRLPPPIHARHSGNLLQPDHRKGPRAEWLRQGEEIRSGNAH